MKVIKHKEDMVHLNFGQNGLTPDGTKKVFKALLSNSSVISVNIGNPESTNKNRIGPKTISKMVELL